MNDNDMILLHRIAQARKYATMRYDYDELDELDDMDGPPCPWAKAIAIACCMWACAVGAWMIWNN